MHTYTLQALLSATAIFLDAVATAPAATAAATKTQYGGVNIAGFDFGSADACGNVYADPYPPLASNGGLDGIGQMNHFVTDNGLNAFRLPVTWQYLYSNNYTANTMNATRLALYDQLVQGCLSSGAALCIIDLHNYARWQGQIIGQSTSAPTIAQFAAFWRRIANKYKGNSQVAFGLMNEPNDDCGNVINTATWQKTLQKAVNAIRNAGATSQYILLPGKHYDHAQTYTGAGGVGNGDTGANILAITDTDGTKNKLIIDVHEYLDQDSSGTHTECTNNSTTDATTPGGVGLQGLAIWLRNNGRQAILSETGGGNVQSCVGYLKQELNFLNKHPGVFLGFTAWAAGSFDSSYELSLTPTYSGGTWTDTLLMAKAVKVCRLTPGKCK